MPRLVEYCNVDSPSGTEGEYDMVWGTDRYELVHLLMTIRHGDRTTLNKINGSRYSDHPRPNTVNVRYEPQLLEPQVLNHVTTVPKTVELRYSPNNEAIPSHNPLHLSNLFKLSGVCGMFVCGR